MDNCNQDYFDHENSMTENQWTNKYASDMVREFHLAFGHPVANEPGLVPEKTARLRRELILEESEEYFEASLENDIVGMADALADLIYVIHGAALAYGIPLDEVVAEVHRSNMSKLGADGKPIYREDGKVLKGPNYFPPNIKEIVNGKDSSGA